MDLIETLNTRTHNNILQEYYFYRRRKKNMEKTESRMKSMMLVNNIRFKKKHLFLEGHL